MENVDAVLNKTNLVDFNKWIVLLSNLGYTSSWEILNAKDYGTPQNRRRCFMVSTRTLGKFIFPEKNPDGRVLRDVLETNVDDSYYLSDERVATFIRHKQRNDAKGNGFGFKIRDLDKPSTAVTCNPDRYCSNWIGEPRTDNIEVMGSLKLKGRHDSALRVYGEHGVSPCLNACGGGGVVPKIEDMDYSDLKIRYLTPRECFRLMAFPDNKIDRLMDRITAKTRLYKMAGNSIAVCCLTAIFKGIYIDKTFVASGRQVSLEGWVIA